MYIMVDLDRTFFLEDTSLLVLKFLLKNDFLFLFHLAWTYCLYGSAKFKAELSPYFDFFNLDAFVNRKLLRFLELQKGAKIVLATGACEGIASKVVRKFPVFSSFIASSDTFNCVGENKKQSILDFVGDEPFFYIGDHFQDFPIWEVAAKVGVVNPSEALLQKIRALNKDFVVFYA